MNIIKDSANGAEMIDIYNVNGILDKKDGIVRVPHLSTQWKVQAEGTKKISIIYYFSIDPGGSLSAWVVNTFAVKGPYETFTKLAELLKQ